MILRIPIADSFTKFTWLLVSSKIVLGITDMLCFSEHVQAYCNDTIHTFKEKNGSLTVRTTTTYASCHLYFSYKLFFAGRSEHCTLVSCQQL